MVAGISSFFGSGVLKGIETGVLTGSGMGILIDGVGGGGI
jgi:hypothetical protein